MNALDYLVLSVALYGANIVVQGVFANLKYDPKTLLGNRDDFAPEGVGLMRAKRAQANFTEAMVLFAPLVLVASATDKLGGLTDLGAAVFFWSRLAYLVSYVAGLGPVRSLVWFGGAVGTGMILWALSPFAA